MHSFDLNLDLVNEEEERTEALGCCSSDDDDEEELNGFIDYFLHGPDSDVSQSNQGRRLPEEESISGSRVRNEGMNFVELGRLGLGLGLGLGIDSDTNNEAPFDLNVSLTDIEMFEFLSGEEGVQNESSEVELVCDEDVNYNDAMMMMIDTSDEFDNGDDDHVLEQFFEHLIYYAAANDDGGNDDTWSQALWLEWDDANWEWDDDTYASSWSMQTVTCDVDNLPSVSLTQEELNKNNSICAICMENFCIEEKLKKLPCFHYYHVDCISPWLRTRNTCPTCRYELPILSL